MENKGKGKIPPDHYHPILLASGLLQISQFPAAYFLWGLWKKVEHWTTCLPLPPFLIAEGGAFVVVFGIEGELWLSWQLLQRKRAWGGGEFIPLSAGSLSGDLQKMKTEG